MDIYIILIIILLLFYFRIQQENFFPYSLGYKYKEEYKTPKKIINLQKDKRCSDHFLLNGLCYNDMTTCQKECRKYSPNGLQNNNYCLDNYDGNVICYPSTW
jgi:hypothetical protein